MELVNRLPTGTKSTILVSLLLATPIAGQSRSVLTVCDVLANRLVHRGKIVAVRGEFLTGYHGSYLRAERCPKPLTTKGFTWPNLIHVAWPSSPLVEDREAKNPSPTIDDASRLLLKRAQPTDRVIATVVGRFETRTEFILVLWGDGTAHGYGYGHLSTSPAQLVQHSIGDVEIVKEPPPAKKTDQ